MSRAWLDRLLAALDDVYQNPDEDWGDEWELGWLRVRVTDQRLLTMRRVRLRSAVLARIEEAGAAFTLDHALKRAYRSMREMFTPLRAPLRDLLKSSGSSIPWTGNAMYFDVVTAKRPASTSKPMFWRDPFVGAT